MTDKTLHVDWTRCDGHGICAALLPERITTDEWGFPIVRDSKVRPDEESDVRSMVAACPALALRLTGSPGSPGKKDS